MTYIKQYSKEMFNRKDTRKAFEALTEEQIENVQYCIYCGIKEGSFEYQDVAEFTPELIEDFAGEEPN